MKVFVYGTLKRGCSNHHFLSSASFIAEDRTVQGYYLVDSGYGYPYMFKGGDEHVSGEVFEIDSHTLSRLDILEGVDHGLYLKADVTLEQSGQVMAYLAGEEPRQTSDHTQRFGIWTEQLD